MRMWPLVAMVMLALTTACAPPAVVPTPASRGEEPAPSAAAAPKTLTVGVQREPTDLGIQFGLGTSSSAGGAGSVKLMVHDKLAIEKELDSWRPQLAVELPSVPWRRTSSPASSTWYSP